MPEMTLAEAAKWAGKGKPAVLKAIQKGTISARKNAQGEWRVDPAELARVYSAASVNGSEAINRNDQEAPGNTRELDLMREMLDGVRRERDDWKAEAASWRNQAETATRLLTHQAAQPEPVIAPPAAPPIEQQEPPAEPAEEPQPRGWWPFGRKR